jgi:hypothetical protein
MELRDVGIADFVELIGLLRERANGNGIPWKQEQSG